MPNCELLQRTMKFVEAAAERGEWYQRDWRVYISEANAERFGLSACGTAMCFAGWSIEAAGIGYKSNDPEKYLDFITITDASQPRGIASRAAELLGLTASEADILFQASNTLADLKRMVNNLCTTGEIYGRR